MEYTESSREIMRPKGGRYEVISQSPAMNESFNPRPPRRAGATDCSLDSDTLSECFNPRPPRRAGATIGCEAAQIFTAVSILAHPGGRALRFIMSKSARCYLFQSSPTPEGGRYPELLLPTVTPLCFNPRPPRRAGAT